ncbi:unnamed protein product, partial [Rangifer tarandus platyrhynchus]
VSKTITTSKISSFIVTIVSSTTATISTTLVSISWSTTTVTSSATITRTTAIVATITSKSIVSTITSSITPSAATTSTTIASSSTKVSTTARVTSTTSKFFCLLGKLSPPPGFLLLYFIACFRRSASYLIPPSDLMFPSFSAHSIFLIWSLFTLVLIFHVLPCQLPASTLLLPLIA